MIGFNANAGLITMTVDEADVEVGSAVTVSLIATSFEEFDLFDFDFNFDDSLFTYDPLSLQSDLPLDDSGFGLGLLVSALSDHLAMSFFGFTPFPGGDFLLAKFELIAQAPGKSDFYLADSSFFGSSGLLIVDTSTTNSVEAATSVPEPSSWLLILMPILLLGARKLK